ncbi:PTS sugar transporter subunit IIA [Gracilibacillus timonensis]|uniref:PTS sugar transporter subunit IIA n=1 Tax=Gracilibacillus timonensis TaxID=1816696 RepID=UPI000824C027|nr:PTS sugar transporter subunit IIA [Gracilibacillus timonensis]
MIGIVIAGHGSFSTAILESVELIAGSVQKAETVEFKDDTDKLEKEIKQAIHEVDGGNGVVCFTDLAGGTPFNICSQVASSLSGVQVIGGINSPMLLSGIFQREAGLQEFVEKVMEDGKSNIKQFAMEKRKESSTSQDGI